MVRVGILLTGVVLSSAFGLEARAATDVAGATTPTAAAGDTPGETTSNPFVGAFETAADWFFARDDDEPAHARTWGFVPLVVADTNSGFGGGMKFVEKDLFASKIRFDAMATYTSYEFFEAETTLDGFRIADLLDWELKAEYRNRPRLYFFGIGNEVRRSDRASLSLEDTAVELRVGGEISTYQLFQISRFSNVNATDGDHIEDVPPVSEAFSPGDLVGFGSAGYTNALGLLAAVDYRDDRADPSFGARFEIGGLYHGPEIGDSPFRYGFYWADGAGYIPLVERNLVLALRGRIELVDTGIQHVPFYGLPQLGGTNTLRGYFEGRVRDRHSILFQAELRFPIWKVLSGGIFIDAGRVYADILDPPFLKDFLVDGGLGLRFVLHPDIVVRLDLAFSREDTTFALAFGHVF